MSNSDGHGNGELKDQYDSLLRELGWRDYSAAMEANLRRKPKGIDVDLPMRKEILKYNMRRYGIYDATRQLAAGVLAAIDAYLIEERGYALDEQVTRDCLARLIVRMLQLQPNNPPVELPAHIANMPATWVREEEAYAYDKEVTRKNLVEHIQEVVSDLMETTIGAHIMGPVQRSRREEEPEPGDAAVLAEVDIEEIEERWLDFEILVSQMMHVHYLEPYFGQTPFLGEAMLACTFKFALDHEDTDLLTMLYKAAAEAGVNIHNHIGVTNEKLLSMLGRAVDAANLQLEMEAFEAAREEAKEKGEDPADAVPKPVAKIDTDIRSGSWIERTNRWRKKVRVNIENGDVLVYRSRTKLAGEIGFAAMPSWKNWRGILRHRLWFGSFTGMLLHLEEDAASDGLDALERIRGRLQHKHWLVPGYNHTGVAKVFEAECGLQQHRAVDAYPDGGIRIVGINQFAHNGPQMRFAVVKADPIKFYRHMKRYRAKFGYHESAWTGHVAEMKEDGGVRQSDREAGWPTTIRKRDYDRLHDGPALAAETPESIVKWKEEVHARMVDHIIEKYLLDWGVHFATGFINVVGGLYCAQTPVMAMLQSSGIDLETHPDHFTLPVRLIGLLGLAGHLPLNSRIVAPSGTYVQPFQVVHGINFPRISPLLQAAAESAPRYVSMSPGMKTALYDPTEENSAALVKDEEEGKKESYFAERAAVVSGAADSLRGSVVKLQQYAGFEDPSWFRRFFRGIRDGVLWVMGM